MEVFYGRLSPVEAHVYVRVAALPGGQRWSVSGTVRGPVSRWARTLPATTSLRDLGAGPALLGGATVPDPCFWSPDMPALYAVNAGIREDGREVVSIDTEIGFRCLGAAGTNLRLENRRWVLRGAAAEANVADIAAWREARLAVLVNNPPRAFCEEAAREGLLIVARLAGPDERLAGQLRDASRSPAIAAAILPANSLSERELRAAAGNLLLGQEFDSATSGPPQPWCDLSFFLLGESDFPPPQLGNLPCVALRRRDRPGDPAALRAECDRLQRDLARYVDLAGYLIIE